MDKWFRYLNEARASRSSPAGIRKAMSDLLDKGPQKKGSPYNDKDNEKPRLKKKKKKDISSPDVSAYAGDVGGIGPGTSAPSLEEEVEPESFEKQPALNERFWRQEGTILCPKVARRLEKIAYDFMEGLEVPAKVEDIRFTGSLANYNWSKYSDIDLHIVVDFAKIDEDVGLVKSFFDSARMRWNDIHDIKIYGYEVEIYVENVGDVHKSSGIYSITNQQWIIEPDPTAVDIDIALARKKSDDIATQVNLIKYIIDREKYDSALRAISRLKEKIRRMRKAGLDSPKQEFSPENIAFKILRREEVLQKLSDMKYDAYDRLMSIK